MLILESSIQLTLRMGRKGVSRVWRMHDSLHVRSTLQLLLVSICLFGVVVEDPLSGNILLKALCQAKLCWSPLPGKILLKTRCQAKCCWRPITCQNFVEGPLPGNILLKAHCQSKFCWRPVARQYFVESPLPGKMLLKAHCQAKFSDPFQYILFYILQSKHSYM